MLKYDTSHVISDTGRSILSYKWLVLAVLMIVGLTNYIDRLSISILQVPIKQDLGLSDLELGAVTGLSFSLVYTVAAVPIARLADRFSPKLVMIMCLIAWNMFTIMCGFANGFLALAMFRMGVAIGEAGCGPASQSLIASYFPAVQRGRAIAIWQMVFPLGSLLGIFAGGMLSGALGWRVTFMVLGSVGLLVVPLVFFVLRDPKRDQRMIAAEARNPQNTVAALREVMASPSFRLLLLGGFLGAVALNAALNWNAPFYGRVFALTIQEITWAVALIAGVGGAIGIFGGGFLADWLGRRDSRWYCWMPGIALLVVPLFAIYQYRFAPDAVASLPAGMIVAILLNCWIPPQAAIAQSLVRPANRALAAACILVSAGFGAAVGPFVTGAVSDLFLAQIGETGRALAWSLSVMTLVAIPAGVLFLLAGNRLRDDLARFRDGEELERAATA